jgi:hypothetical protein
MTTASHDYTHGRAKLGSVVHKPSWLNTSTLPLLLFSSLFSSRFLLPLNSSTLSIVERVPAFPSPCPGARDWYGLALRKTFLICQPASPPRQLQAVTTRVSSKQSIFFLVRTETNRNSICFGCFSVCFAKPKNIFSVCFSLFRFVSVFRTSIETTETNRTLSKQTKKSF